MQNLDFPSEPSKIKILYFLPPRNTVVLYLRRIYYKALLKQVFIQ